MNVEFSGEPGNAVRDVRVTRPAGGSFSRGNRFSAGTGPEIRYEVPAVSGAGFDLPAKPVDPDAPKFRRKAKPEPARGLVDPETNLERPLREGRAIRGAGKFERRVETPDPTRERLPAEALRSRARKARAEGRETEALAYEYRATRATR